MSQFREPENPIWNSPDPNPEILPNQVHLWRVRLDGVGYRDERLAAVLSAEEQERAQRFHFDQHRQRFIRTHGILREILAKYTRIDPARLAFATGSHGKPFLIPDQPYMPRFNLSHSGDLMVLGVAVDLELGVDVEIINDRVEWKHVAADFFNPEEIVGIASLPTLIEQLKAFYRVWTLKEAYLKARRDGLAGGLDRVVVNLDPGKPELFLAFPGGENEKRRWQANTFRPAAGACGALVAQRGQSTFNIIQYNWTEE
jgi:4'-phosphopantetheinyl transferase